MAKRISDEERILNYFQTAGRAAVTVLYRLVVGVTRARFPGLGQKKNLSKTQGEKTKQVGV